MSTEPIVSIVDDDPAFADSLAILILSIGLKSKVYVSADQFLATFDQQQRGCLILDVRMPHISGLALQEKLANFPLCPPVIILTGHAEIPTALRALKLGAIEFLQKTCTESELREAIQRAIVLDSERFASFTKTQKLVERLAQLSRPEHQVLDLVLKGYPNKRIASALDVSQRAVEDRRARVMQKLGVDNLPELVRLALAAGVKIDD